MLKGKAVHVDPTDVSHPDPARVVHVALPGPVASLPLLQRPGQQQPV
jgi:hypothetical protein